VGEAALAVGGRQARRRSARGLIELFDVPPGEDERFLAAWRQAPPPGAWLYRALREDVTPRYAGVTLRAEGGVVLVGRLLDEHALETFAPRQGCIASLREGDLVAVHWSSPLMYDRSVRAHGALVRGALYAIQRATST
jgi:hypothetical protein